jgi:glutathione S-transferase
LVCLGEPALFPPKLFLATPKSFCTLPGTHALPFLTAFAFNCAQRSHANFTEHHASAVAALLIAGLRFPLAASACGLGWTIARAAYMVGYSTSKPETKGRGRYKGAAFWAFELALIGMAGYTGVQMLLN